MATVIKAPRKQDFSKFSVFLAGTIDNGDSIDWQNEFEKAFSSNSGMVILNPRRDDWDCVDEETKCLTNNGIKKFDEINIDEDKILTFNMKTNQMEYQKIDKVNIYDVKNIKLNEFNRNGYKYYFTDNHNLVSRKDSSATSFIFKKGNSKEFRVISNSLLNDSEYLIDESKQYINDYFKLAGWFLSEGCVIRESGKSAIVRIAQYQKNENKVFQIKTLLGDLNLEFYYNNKEFILSKEASSFVLDFLNLKKQEIPNWIKLASIDKKRDFINTYGLGDGCYCENKLLYIAFSEKYKKYVEEFQILAYECGYTTLYRKKTSGFGHDVVNLSFHDINKKTTIFSKNGEIDYTGKIWCPSTKNGTWVAYRNGLPFITGNSSWVAEMGNPEFEEQVSWELESQEQCDLIVVFIGKDSKSPITLLEIGLFHKRNMIICCEEGFYRKGNVDMVCDRYKVPSVKTLDELIEVVKQKYLIK